MSYTVIWTPRARQRLNGLDVEIKGRILEKVETTREIPHHYFEKLSGMDSFKLRVGDYRVIAAIVERDKVILVQSAGHRKNIYKQ